MEMQKLPLHEAFHSPDFVRDGPGNVPDAKVLRLRSYRESIGFSHNRERVRKLALATTWHIDA
jgi:hypothetical protein